MRKPVSIEDIYSAHYHNAPKVAARAMEIIRELEAENERLRIAVEVQGNQLCQFHDTNPLNETVVELEQHRDALEAENRVVRELVEDALDWLWRYDLDIYQRFQPRCTWLMGEEHQKPLDAEEVLRRLGVRVEAKQSAPETPWFVIWNGRPITPLRSQGQAEDAAQMIRALLTGATQQLVDPLLARIAALTREYQDYMTIANHCTAVYSHFSGGRISKPFTLPSVVIDVAEAIQQEEFEKYHQERLGPIKDRLEEFHLAWRVLGPESKSEEGDALTDWIEETFKEAP